MLCFLVFTLGLFGVLLPWGLES